ncbi:MAG: hypothetical protein ACJAUV_000157 [Flavobacteriales bacterium]|jgi:hypothetical protein
MQINNKNIFVGLILDKLHFNGYKDHLSPSNYFI